MGYLEDNLSPSEKLVYETTMSRIIFVIPFILFLFGIIAGCLIPVSIIFKTSFVVLAFIPSIKALNIYLSSTLGVTTKRVIVKTGFLSTKSLEIQLDKIESIMIFQNLSEKLLGCGTVILYGTGGTKDEFPRIAAPFEFKKMVECQMDIA